jgi:gag-polyprotein putative aspartyl protease
MRGVLFASFLVAAGTSLAVAGNIHRGEPIKMVHGYPVVTAFFNGRGPFRMLLDTGAARCALRPSLAARAGLVPKRRLLLTTMSGEQIVPATQTAVRLDSLEVLNVEVLIYDVPGLDRLESHVDGLLGQSFLAQGPYLVDYRAKRLWFGDEALTRAQRFNPPIQVKLSYGRPVVPVGIGSKTKPFRLILDSGVDRLVLRCADQCPTLIGQGTLQAITNAGETKAEAGCLPVVMVGPAKFFRMQAVLMRGLSDSNEGEGLLPLQWFSAVYVDTAQRLVRFAR